MYYIPSFGTFEHSISDINVKFHSPDMDEGSITDQRVYATKEKEMPEFPAVDRQKNRKLAQQGQVTCSI